MRKNASRPDDENPEWTAKEIREARSFMGRAAGEDRRRGPGWQTRANDALRAYAKNGLTRPRTRRRVSLERV
jgi:uncharacterized protein (DUF4415 family)